MTTIKPTSASNRIDSLDILRGFALLGILIMNMISFSMVGANYLNPMAEGQLQGADEWAFIFSQLFANQKFMSLFSILFGAGIILMTDRMVAKGSSPAKRHYSRNFWLLLFGLAHAYLIWMGDILVPYAICSLWVYLFRKKSAKTLFILAAVFYFIVLALGLMTGFSMPYWGEAEIAELCTGWVPSGEAIATETAAYKGSWLDQMPVRASGAFYLETFVFVFSMGWQITGLMLIGMGLYKTKVITAERSSSFYKKMMLSGFGLGLTLGIIGLFQNYKNDWSCEYSFFIGSQFNFLGSLPMALGYIGLIMWLSKSKVAELLKEWLAPVGRTALSNYLMQSIIVTLIFYGHGLGLFGTVGRAEQWLFILGIWLAQVIVSRWWMNQYRFGPFEWVWR
ncbi:MAG: DUF418 domain-containing protein, partial [Saprospiraceae bacterium]|nr:DUF418 domain-containing protein [Saprospiraceae bacterium]